jgi:ribonuclease HII
MVAPDLAVERGYWAQGRPRVAGVDEVGIGALSGPVVAAAVLLPRDCPMIPGVRDSKTLGPTAREALAAAIADSVLAVGLGAASVVEIDRLNVLRASHLAMRRALARLGPVDQVLVDGRPVRDDTIGPHHAIVDGDASCYAIACASIVAKVCRDRLMRRLAARYPAYGWERNVGYGTTEHRASLRIAGLSPYHRRSYAPVRELLEPVPAETEGEE